MSGMHNSFVLNVPLAYTLRNIMTQRGNGSSPSDNITADSNSYLPGLQLTDFGQKEIDGDDFVV